MAIVPDDLEAAMRAYHEAQAAVDTAQSDAKRLLLADRNYATADLAATGADLLVRCKSSRRLPRQARYRDGSYLSLLGGVPVRVIDAQISVATSTGRHVGAYRLVTTLLDDHRHPAAAVPLVTWRPELEG
jgi:hypothetical protein